jgi:hypothetical protein
MAGAGGAENDALMVDPVGLLDGTGVAQSEPERLESKVCGIIAQSRRDLHHCKSRTH